MTDDIVKRLQSTGSMSQTEVWETIDEAADTITALRAEVEKLTAERDAAMMTGHDLAKEEYRDKLQAAEAERDRLRAALAEKVRVKPLAWGPDEAPNDHCHYDHCTSSGGAWSYRIERLRQIRRDRWKGWKRYDSFVIYRDEEYLEAETTLIAAKAAAQADYEARILATLTTKGEADAG